MSGDAKRLRALETLLALYRELARESEKEWQSDRAMKLRQQIRVIENG